MTSFRIFFPTRTRLTLLAAAAAGLSLLAWSASGSPRPVFDARCESQDSAAAAAVAELIADRSPDVEQRLGDIVFRLRRARAYCRFGLVGLAQLDYRALVDGRYAGSQVSSTRSATADGGR
jgi:hypothetical protein